MNTFFDEITASLSKAAIRYENMGDFNIDIKKNRIVLWIVRYFLRPFEPYKLNSFRETFNEIS